MKATQFYSGQIPDHKGRSLKQLQEFTFEQLEEVHDYIQWMFPTRTASAYNNKAPILTKEDAIAFKTDPVLQDRLRDSYHVMMRFYGVEGDYQLAEGKNGFWIHKEGDHNYLRITRILESLVLLGLDKEALDFLLWLEELNEDPTWGGVFNISIDYWRQAVLSEWSN